MINIAKVNHFILFSMRLLLLKNEKTPISKKGMAQVPIFIRWSTKKSYCSEGNHNNGNSNKMIGLSEIIFERWINYKEHIIYKKSGVINSYETHKTNLSFLAVFF